MIQQNNQQQQSTLENILLAALNIETETREKAELQLNVFNESGPDAVRLLAQIVFSRSANHNVRVLAASQLRTVHADKNFCDIRVAQLLWQTCLLEPNAIVSTSAGAALSALVIYMPQCPPLHWCAAALREPQFNVGNIIGPIAFLFEYFSHQKNNKEYIRGVDPIEAFILISEPLHTVFLNNSEKSIRENSMQVVENAIRIALDQNFQSPMFISEIEKWFDAFLLIMRMGPKCSQNTLSPLAEKTTCLTAINALFDLSSVIVTLNPREFYFQAASAFLKDCSFLEMWQRRGINSDQESENHYIYYHYIISFLDFSTQHVNLIPMDYFYTKFLDVLADIMIPVSFIRNQWEKDVNSFIQDEIITVLPASTMRQCWHQFLVAVRSKQNICDALLVGSSVISMLNKAIENNDINRTESVLVILEHYVCSLNEKADYITQLIERLLSVPQNVLFEARVVLFVGHLAEIYSPDNRIILCFADIIFMKAKSSSPVLVAASVWTLAKLIFRRNGGIRADINSGEYLQITQIQSDLFDYALFGLNHEEYQDTRDFFLEILKKSISICQDVVTLERGNDIVERLTNFAEKTIDQTTRERSLESVVQILTIFVNSPEIPLQRIFGTIEECAFNLMKRRINLQEKENNNNKILDSDRFCSGARLFLTIFKKMKTINLESNSRRIMANRFAEPVVLGLYDAIETGNTEVQRTAQSCLARILGTLWPQGNRIEECLICNEALKCLESFFNKLTKENQNGFLGDFLLKLFFTATLNNRFKILYDAAKIMIGTENNEFAQELLILFLWVFRSKEYSNGIEISELHQVSTLSNIKEDLKTDYSLLRVVLETWIDLHVNNKLKNSLTFALSLHTMVDLMERRHLISQIIIFSQINININNSTLILEEKQKIFEEISLFNSILRILIIEIVAENEGRRESISSKEGTESSLIDLNEITNEEFEITNNETNFSFADNGGIFTKMLEDPEDWRFSYIGGISRARNFVSIVLQEIIQEINYEGINIEELKNLLGENLYNNIFLLLKI